MDLTSQGQGSASAGCHKHHNRTSGQSGPSRKYFIHDVSSIIIKHTGGSTWIPMLLEPLELLGNLGGVRPLEGLNGTDTVRFCGRRLGLYVCSSCLL
jgi:hypothetical protein